MTRENFHEVHVNMYTGFWMAVQSLPDTNPLEVQKEISIPKEEEQNFNI